jgi:hypothetical protein
VRIGPHKTDAQIMRDQNLGELNGSVIRELK